jgi:hypothetical protein
MIEWVKFFAGMTVGSPTPSNQPDKLLLAFRRGANGLPSRQAIK